MGAGALTSVAILVGCVFLIRYYVLQPPARVVKAGRTLLRAELLQARKDLGLLLTLAVTSPSFLDQLEAEIDAGAGAQLEALVGALRVPREAVIAAFHQARERVPVVRSDRDAARLVTRFMYEISPRIEVDSIQAGELLWGLERELAGGAPARSPVHMRIAKWLEVPGEEVARASRAVLRGEGAAALSRRALYASGATVLDAFADQLEAGHSAQLEARFKALSAHGASFDPELSTVTGPAIVP